MTLQITPSAERVAALSSVLESCQEGRSLMRELRQKYDMGGRQHAPAMADKQQLTLSFNALSMADDVIELCKKVSPPDTPSEEIDQRAARIREQVLASSMGETDIATTPVGQMPLRAGASITPARHTPPLLASRPSAPRVQDATSSSPSRQAQRMFARATIAVSPAAPRRHAVNSSLAPAF